MQETNVSNAEPLCGLRFVKAEYRSPTLLAQHRRNTVFPHFFDNRTFVSGPHDSEADCLRKIAELEMR